MNKEEYLKKLDELNLDKNMYCIISGGVMLMHNLKETTQDIDIKVKPEYFNELEKRFNIKKSPKYDYLYELSDEIEVAKLDFNEDEVEYIDGYPIELLEIELDWKIKNNREKDQEAIKVIKKYLSTKNR